MQDISDTFALSRFSKAAYGFRHPRNCAGKAPLICPIAGKLGRCGAGNEESGEIELEYADFTVRLRALYVDRRN